MNSSPLEAHNRSLQDWINNVITDCRIQHLENTWSSQQGWDSQRWNKVIPSLFPSFVFTKGLQLNVLIVIALFRQQLVMCPKLADMTLFDEVASEKVVR